MTCGWVRWIVILLGVRNGPCGGLEDGHPETKGVPLEGRCGNALPRRMLPLTDRHVAGVGDGSCGGLEDGHQETKRSTTRR